MSSSPEQRNADAVAGGRPRRADWVDTRQRILQSAQALFARRGYARTSTAELAEAAGVVESTLFRHFPTKAQLFEQAVIAPLRTSVDGIAERRRLASAAQSTEGAALDFYDEMIGAAREDSGLLIAALAALTFEGETDEFAGLKGAFSELLGYMDESLGRRTVERGFAVDPVIGARAMLAVALGFALAEALLFDDGAAPSSERLAVELARFTAYGLPGRP